MVVPSSKEAFLAGAKDPREQAHRRIIRTARVWFDLGQCLGPALCPEVAGNQVSRRRHMATVPSKAQAVRTLGVSFTPHSSVSQACSGVAGPGTGDPSRNKRRGLSSQVSPHTIRR